MDEKSQDFTAFSTPFGSYKWLRMPMGLTGSPNTFQSLMEHVLVGLTWKTTVPYLDDCIIFAATPEEHLERLRAVLQRFREANLKINPLKCEFFKTKVHFLGHVLSADGLQVDPEKIAAVKKFPIPTSQTEVKSFLGLCSYYRRYVENFAEIARPLHKLTECSPSFSWTTEAQTAFETLQARLLTTPILAFPSMKEPFILYTDASLTAMGAVLAQVQNGKERAICYASKAFSKAQTRYSATKRELLAIVHFTRHFRHYLLGRKFTIVTDHRALQWLHNFKDPDGLTARWLEKLAAFDYEVRHKPGKSIGHADGLSRIPQAKVQIIHHDPKVVDLSEVQPTVEDEWPNAKPGTDSNTLPTEVLTTPHQAPQPPNPTSSANPNTEVETFEYHEKVGDIFSSSDSLAHCVSSDFKMSAGIARTFRRKYPTNYPKFGTLNQKSLWPQFLESSQRYIYHLLTKVRFFHKPTYCSLRTSLAALRRHAEDNDVNAISMPKLGCGIDQLEWHLVRQIIKEEFATSQIRLTVYMLDSTELQEVPNNSVTDHANTSFTKHIRIAQDGDESLKLVKDWVRQSRVPRNNDLQGSPRLAWRLYNQFSSLCISDGVLCRKFDPTDGRVSFLQQIVPQSLVEELLRSTHSTSTGGHLGVAKVTEKIRQRFYWPGFQEDVKLFISRCPQCQKRSNPPKAHRHALVDWKASYPFHHIGIDFMGPLLESNGHKVILLIGDHFTKWYEAVPLPDQRASTTATALIEHWISRFGCPHSIHSDQGRNFESLLFKNLLSLLEIDKSRTTAFHPQSNAVIERMNRTLQNMLAKCINAEQNNWSQQLPYVMMAYRSSVHESTGYTPQFLVHGRETSLPLDLMFPSPESDCTTNVHEFVHQRKQAFQRAFALVRDNLNKNQRRRNAIYNHKVHGPTYRDGQEVLLHTPVVPVGQSPKFFSPWRGPYTILKCLNDVNYQIKEVSTGKESVVHYDRLKPFRKRPPTTNIPTREKIPEPATSTSNVPTQNRTPRSSTPRNDIDHTYCTEWPSLPLPQQFSPSIATSSSGGNLAKPCPIPAIPTPPMGTVTVPHTPASTLPYGQNSAQTTPITPTSTSTSIENRTSIPSSSPVSQRLSNKTFSPSTPTSRPGGRSRKRKIIDQAAAKLRVASQTPQEHRTLRASTMQQRRAQPLFMSNVPTNLTDFNSPNREGRAKPQR